MKGMSGTFRAALVAALALGAGKSLSAQSRPAASDSMKVVAVLNAALAAQERNDEKGLDSLYAGEALTIIEGASINRGWKDFWEHHLGPELKDMKDLQFKATNVEVKVNGNMAWAIFQFTKKYQAPTRAVDYLGRGTAIFEKTNGRWVIRHYQDAGRTRRPTDPPA
jgi:ketosteroid isomerase-like protein